LVERIEVERLARERGKGLEEAARFARYGFLKKALEDWPGDYLVTAHQAEDQAETVIMKLARGAGPGALVGIGAKGTFGEGQGVRALRPLLGESAKGLREYAAAKGLGFIEDPSNLDERFGRNLVRNKILPVLGQLNEGYLAAFGRAAEIAAAEEEFWDERLRGLEEKLELRAERGWFGVRAQGLAQVTLAEKRRLLGRLMRKVRLDKPGGGEGVSFSGVEAALGFLERPGAGGVDLPGGRRVEIRGLFIYIGPSSRNESRPAS
jgi:tRNA(Ile)-lysidine synthase